MPRIYRTLGPGRHSLAETVLIFDATGVAESDDEAVLATVEQFPTMFMVLGADDPVPGAPPEVPEIDPQDDEPRDIDEPDDAILERRETTDRYQVLEHSEVTERFVDDVEPPVTPTAPRLTTDTLEMMTVVELRELASHYAIPRASALNKAELVAAIVAAQG